ncbi:hypothetical protein AB0I28_27760 [Phytomonospora sp. NPDC050363]|uniref:hypothetical protein n=1 Tax=Phytomonospora sp. NPDC050363 TaxID=3155642 RepID=UPI0034073065
MDSPNERGALGVRTPSVYENAVRRLAEHREGALRPALPDRAENDRQTRERVPAGEREPRIVAEIERYLTLPERSPRFLHARLSKLDLIHDRGPLPAGRKFAAADERLAEVGRRLARYASNRVPLMVGLALLEGRAGPPDAEVLRHLALYPGAVGAAAVRVLAAMPEPVGDLMWIAGNLTQHLSRNAAVAWLLRHGLTGPDDRSRDNAMAVSEAVDLPAALRDGGDDVGLVRHAAYRLLAMPRQDRGRGALLRYPGAIAAYTAFAEARAVLPVEDHGLVSRILDDLHFHVPALPAWPEDTRKAAAERLLALLGPGSAAAQRVHDHRSAEHPT